MQWGTQTAYCNVIPLTPHCTTHDNMKKIDKSTITENISLWEGVFGILDMSRYSIVFACIAWSKSPLDT